MTRNRDNNNTIPNNPWFKTNPQNHGRNDSNNARNSSNNNVLPTTAPATVGQLSTTMQTTSLSENKSRPSGQTMARSEAIAYSQSSAPSRDPAPSQASGQVLANTTTKSTSANTTPGKNKTEEGLCGAKKSTFFDARYVTTAAVGGLGDKVRMRINERTLTKRPLKKSLIYKVLSEDQPWTPEYRRNLIYTDWNSTIVTTKPLEMLATGKVVVSDNGEISAPYTFVNQSDPPGTPASKQTATIKLAHVIDSAALEKYVKPGGDPSFDYSKHTTVLNHMVKHFAAQPGNAICIGSNKIFDIKAQGHLDLPSGLHARRGFFSSIRPVNNGMQLQLNTKGAAFIPDGPVVPFLKKYFKEQFDPDVVVQKKFNDVWPEVRALLSHLKVRYRYDPPNPRADPQARSDVLQDPENGSIKGRRKVINSFGKPSNQQRFKHSFFTEKETWTVEDHFNKHVLRSTRLEFPKLPVVNVGAKSTDKKKNMEVWVPMELLWIEADQPLRSTVPDCDMDMMGKYIRTDPRENVERIVTNGRRLLHAQNLQAVLPMAAEMSTVTGRRLAAPVISYGKVKIPILKSSTGKWNIENVTPLEAGAALTQLLVIVVNSDMRKVGRVDYEKLLGAQGLMGGLDHYGVKCSGYQLQIAASTSRHDLHSAYNAFDNPEDLGKNIQKVRTVLVVLPSKDANDYAAVKTWGELHDGVNTICVTAGKQHRLIDYDFQANLALKFNAKLRGQNHKLDKSFFEYLCHGQSATMVVGADVTHPGPSSVDYCPSIAAVVASTDSGACKYSGSIRLQASREEIITDLQGMMTERLKVWYFAGDRRTLPPHILYYRDGVSESQFGAVKEQELTAIKSACAKAGASAQSENYTPKITVVICTKRHQTRFYPTSLNPGKEFDSKTGNPLPGMVVDDRAIRLPHYFDFYLQGHKALQGTARPCHYFVIENGIGYNPDQLQAVTYGLSWVYATSLTPISLAAPAYYADRLCERGRAYLRPALIGRHPDRPDMTAALANATTEEEAKAAAVRYLSAHAQFWPQAIHPVHPSIRDTMFWV
ncbi:hypothetical protein DOTSEDRAFT_92165 [Dothistroma septosporum NZE10]|uniref:Piwi domain-containing protein n=1 Tax=Dothistroma septosporum (strain NZE10 / CBS 128990) TaxID=675120 RepID=M2XHF9_DOTSN|nr:hypothetical protein DOTSEDRAFT_92165 [Dothistroma septosporum NZE10]